MMRIALLCFLLIGFSAPAFADSFTLTDGSDTIAFSLPASPTPPLYNSEAFEFVNVPTSVDGSLFATNVLFYSSVIHGGLNLTVNGMNKFLLTQSGAQLFSGSSTSPSFLLGTFSLTDTFGSGADTYSKNFSLTIAPDVMPTPEPASFLLLGSGLLSATGVVRRRLAS